MKREDINLDFSDRAVLAIVQQNAATPLRTIADQVNLSTASVQRRLRRMEELGVIQANVAVLDPTLVGKPITILVEVRIERAQLDVLDALKIRFSGPEIQQCYYVTGEADFVLILTVANMEEYQALARHLFYENKEVKWFRTIVVMDRVKVGLTVPINHVHR